MPEITASILEMPNAHGPYGAKGIGEMPNIPTPAAVNNAIANAIGARLYDVPIESEAVWRALNESSVLRHQ
jgi:CO/xanthine dehydrogenase Mo-binding subunit